MKKVSILIVSGYLGAGKTTLVKHLLSAAQRDGIRLAIVSNEFGELGIDRALFGEASDSYVELEGGCVCCQLSSELLVTLQTLRDEVDPDRIVIETSGLALPFDLQLHLLREPVRSWLADDLVAVVVNAEQVLAERELEGTFEDQVTSADLLILNKIDLVLASDVELVEGRIRQLEPEAPIVHAVDCAVDPCLLFPPEPGALREPTIEHTHAHRHDEFESFEIAVAANEDRQSLLDSLAAHDALRIKGFIKTPEGISIVQGVGPRIDIQPIDFSPRDDLIGRLVVIRRK